jgi:hypothetical protein
MASIAIVGPEQARTEGAESSPRSATGKSKRSRRATERAEIDLHLFPASAEDWKKQDLKTAKRHYKQLELDFFSIIDDYIEQANAAASQYKSSLRAHARWRFWIIVATGALAAINICAAFDLKITLLGITLPRLLTVVAALYAGCLTVAGNIENLFNKAEQAAGSRELRDLLLSRYREYRSKWICYVEAHGNKPPTPIACVNAGRLYRELVDSDHELRQKIKQLTDIQRQKAGKRTSSGSGGKAGHS